MSWTGPSNMMELFHGSPFFNVFDNFLKYFYYVSYIDYGINL